MAGVIRVLTVGHSYAVAMNRAVAREVARGPGFEVTVGAPAFFRGDLRDIECEPEPEGSPLNVVPLKSGGSRWIHTFHYHSGELRRLARGGHDLVHAWEEPYLYAGYQVATAADGTGAPFCFRTAQSLSKLMPPPSRYFERSTLSRARGWVAGGTLVYDAMRARGYPADSGRVIPLAVDTSAFAPPSAAARAEALGELGLAPPVVGFVGRLTREKGLRVLTAAMERIGGARPWSLLLLGSGPLKGEVERWARARGWAGRVRVKLARHDEVPRYLGAVDVLAAPSQTTRRWKEQFGRMLVEAFACGVPVVGSDSGEVPHVIGDAGLVVGEKDVEGWAAAIGGLLDRPEGRAELSRRGLERCREYSVQAVAQRYRNFYTDLVERGPR